MLLNIYEFCVKRCRDCRAFRRGALAVTHTPVLWIYERRGGVCVLRHGLRHLQSVILMSVSYFSCSSDF